MLCSQATRDCTRALAWTLLVNSCLVRYLFRDADLEALWGENAQPLVWLFTRGDLFVKRLLQVSGFKPHFSSLPSSVVSAHVGSDIASQRQLSCTKVSVVLVHRVNRNNLKSAFCLKIEETLMLWGIICLRFRELVLGLIDLFVSVLRVLEGRKWKSKSLM